MSINTANISMQSTISIGSDPIKVNLLFEKIGKILLPHLLQTSLTISRLKKDLLRICVRSFSIS